MRIKVNGKEAETAQSTVEEIRKTCKYRSAEFIVLKNGFSAEDDEQVREGDELFFIPKGAMPKEDELEAMLCARHTPGVHNCIKKARVGIAGLGGLGSSVALALARTGIGVLHLVDFDSVEPSNLNRQQYRIAHLGMAKTEALKAEIAEINPYVKVITDNCRVTAENAAELFSEDEIVCEAFDRPEAKAMLAEEILLDCPGAILVSASGMAGYGDSNRIRTRKINERFYLCGDEAAEAGPGLGLMAPRVSICAGHQANLILQLILENKGEKNNGR